MLFIPGKTIEDKLRDIEKAAIAAEYRAHEDFERYTYDYKRQLADIKDYYTRQREKLLYQNALDAQ